MKIDICCKDMHTAFVEDLIFLNEDNEIMTVTINKVNVTKCIIFSYCPYCGKKIEVNDI